MNGSRLVALMTLSITAVAGLALWDETRESSAAFDRFAQEQAALSGVAAAGLAAQLDVIRRDALAAADEAAEGRRISAAIAHNYVALRVHGRDEAAPEPGRDGRARALTISTPDGRRVDVLVPSARLVPGEPWLAREGARVFVRPPGERSFYATDGRPARAGTLERAADAGRTSALLGRPEAAALGLPERRAVAGIAEVDAEALGRWSVAVVASAARERDREARGQRRLVLGVLVAAVLVLSLGGLALRTQRKGFELERAVEQLTLQRERDAQLERESRAATMVTLAAGVAHEVSSPLGVISGRAEQLAPRVAGDERSQRAVQVILEQAERIREVVRGFLRLARGETAALAPVAPGAVARAAAELVEHRFREANILLVLDVHAPLPEMRGDARLLEHALVNLLLNARDACVAGGSVALRARSEGAPDARHAEVVFEVDDDGTGISPEHAARLIEPFFSTKPADAGTGLGLAIANEIAKIHRGTLAIAPRPARGTRAQVRIPMTPEGGPA